MIDYTRLLERLNPTPGGESLTRLRNGVANALNLDGSVDVLVSGVVVPDVPRLEGARPAVGDTVVMIAYLGQFLILDTIATSPPSISVYDRDSASYEDFNSSGFSPTANAPVITFWVPKSGGGTITMFVRADADNLNERLIADVRIRHNNSGGSQVHTPGEEDGGVCWTWNPDFNFATNHPGERPLEPLNLTPGQYWARLEIDTEGTNMDIFDQWIRFDPE